MNNMFTGQYPSEGLPVRPGAQPCSYYMKTGRCKFGATCKFTHPPNSSPMSHQTPPQLRSPQSHFGGSPTRFPEPYKSEPYDPYAGGSPVMPSARQPAFTPYESVAGGYRNPIKPASPPPSFMNFAQPYSPPASTPPYSAYSPMGGPPAGYPPPAIDPHARGYAGSVAGWGARNAFTQNCPTFVSNGSCPEGNKCRFKHPKLSSYPRRPGQPACRHFLIHQRCDFGNTCKFDHPPPGAICRPVIPALDEGSYPQRPGEPDCKFYMKHGTCQFGLTCKFNHPPRGKPTGGVPSLGVGVGSLGTENKAIDVAE